MSLILKEQPANTVPTPPAGKGTLFLNDSGAMQVRQSDGNLASFPTINSGGDEQVLFNQLGGIGGNSGFIYDYANGMLTVPNVTVTGTLTAGDIGVSSIANGTSNVDIVGVSGNITISVTGVANVLSVTTTGANVAGTLSASGTATVGNLVTGGTLSATGNTTVGNLSVTGTLIAGDISVSSIANGTSNVDIVGVSGNVTTSVGGVANVFVVTTTGANVAGTLSASGNANVGNLAVIGSIAVPLVKNGTSNIGIESSGNVTIGVGGTTNVAVITQSGIYLTGFISTSANANVANLRTDGLITAVGNITGGNIITPGQVVSSVATGTAPLVVTSTTQVANLSVATAGLATYATTANAVAGGNVSGTVANATYATSAGSATTAGTVTTNAQPNITSTGTLTTLSVSGNANIGNIGTGIVTASGNVTGANIIASSYHIRSVGTGIAAAGTTQGTATALTKEINIVSTVSAGNGVVLPTAVAGMVLTITNSSATALLVYPATSGQINALGANTGLSQPASATLQFIAPTSTQWYTVGATYA